MAFAAPLALGLGAVGGVFNAIGQAGQSESQAQQYKYQAGIAAQNAQIAKQNEQYALIQGEQTAARSGMASRFQAGQIRAAQGASGFNVNTGTNAEVQASQKAIGQTEQTAIRSTAAKQAYDYNIGSLQATEQGQMYSAAAQNTEQAIPLQIAGSILGTGTSVATKWSGLAASGALPSTGILGGFA